MPTLRADSVTPLGITTFRRREEPFGIRQPDRRRHLYILGRTGVGKSALLENIIAADFRAGRGVAVLDPHGDLAERLLDLVPRHRFSDVVFLDPSDSEHPFGFNVLENVPENDRHLVASWVTAAFKKLFLSSWGPRLEYLLRTSLLTVLTAERPTLLDVLRILQDEEYREQVVARCPDQALVRFWDQEFASYPKNFLQEAIAPIQNKVGAFVTHPVLRNLIGQERSTWSVERVMTSGGILIANLSKGRLGEDASHLLGALLVTAIWYQALRRARLPEADRLDFHLVVDEFQNFSTGTFPDILSEARKYCLTLTLAHQYRSQVPEDIREAVAANVGTIIAFRTGAEDAKWLAEEFAPVFSATDILRLPRYAIAMRLLVDGRATDPFSARTLPPPSERGDKFGKTRLVALSRLRYTRPVQQVSRSIASRYGTTATPSPRCTAEPLGSTIKELKADNGQEENAQLVP